MDQRRVYLLIFFVVFKICQGGQKTRPEMKDGKATSSYHVSENPCEADNIDASARNYTNLGFQLQKDKEYEKALICFNKALDLDPFHVEYFRNRADCYFEKGDYQKAQEDYKAIGRLNPLEKTDQTALIKELFDNEMFMETIQEMLIMDNPDELVNLGDKLTTATRYNEALICYGLAINEAPGNARYYRQRAKCHIRAKMFFPAMSDYRDAIWLDPENPDDTIDFSNMEEYKEYSRLLDRPFDVTHNLSQAVRRRATHKGATSSQTNLPQDEEFAGKKDI